MIIKLSIVIGCLYFIYTKLLENKQFNFAVFYNKLIENNLFSFKNMFFLGVFSVLNWGIEITKWKSLVQFIKNISFFNAAKQSLASLTTSLITPNRIGEYGAKAMYFDKKYRKQILGLNLIGNFYQMLMTLIFGSMGFGYFVLNHKIEIDFYPILKILLLAIIIVSVLFFALNYFNLKWFSLEKAKNFIKKIPKKLNLKTAILSLLRYVVFSHQFYFLLLIFKVDISYVDAILAITSVYLIASIIPMLSLFDVVLKGSVAIWVFSFFNIAPLTILSVTTLMWILNFVFPAIIGSYFVLTFKPNLAE
ncbi:hypothetical protein MC378_07215 [Polaribacter sp. MSW13]|uniref:Lysylphosphatidylglycerol synthase TM region n=1 Tax=Polaribacter marinus TaxID=2916838 RepID=A0A9X1VPW3_9FLAO|nr:hypothetical protein [Polaribacter marinus]